MKNFSYNEYAYIINWLNTHYTINKFTDINKDSDNFCVIRHDVEFSIDRALRLALLENKLGISTTYLFQIRNNVYNALSVDNVKKIRKIHELGHDIGLHVHRGLLEDYNTIEDMICTDIDILSKITGIDTQIFSLHRPTIELLTTNIKIDGLINTYDKLYFHSYADAVPPKNLNVKYIADSNHIWKYGYPTTINHSKLQCNFHPFSWTESGYENTPNFKTLIEEKTTELINSISTEIKTFPKELL